MNSGFIIVIVILVCFLLIYQQYKKRYAAEIFNSIKHDYDIVNSRKFVKYAPVSTSVDQYKLASIYDIVLKDFPKAQHYYRKALKNNPNGFVTTKIADRLQLPVPYPEEYSYEIQQDLLNYFNNVAKSKSAPKKLEKKVSWVSDSQNVHDSHINTQIKNNFKIISTNEAWSPSRCLSFLEVYKSKCDSQEKHNIENGSKMLKYIFDTPNNKSTIMHLNGISEKQFIGHVFAKIAEMPEEKQKTLMENLMLNLADSYGKGSPVCITGRTTRVLSTFDGNDIGVEMFKSKPAIRNEILLKSANIRNKILDACDTELKAKYEKGTEDAETNNIIQKIKTEIKVMLKEYDLDKDFKQSLEVEIDACL